MAPARKRRSEAKTSSMRSKKVKSNGQAVQLQDLPLEIRQRIYFLAFDQNLTINNELLRTYTSRFKKERTLPALASVDESTRLAAFYPLVRSSIFELARLEEKTLIRAQSYIDKHGLGFDFMNNIVAAKITIKEDSWRFALDTAELMAEQCVNVRVLLIDVGPIGHRAAASFWNLAT